MQTPPRESIRTKVIARYSQVATSAENRFKYPVGSENLRRLNYPSGILDGLPAATKQFFCGVGNLFSVGTVHRGESVLDVGCGAGVDSLVAGLLVGPSGSVVGIDITQQLLERARANLSATPFSNVRFMLARGEEIPLPDCSVDVVISTELSALDSSICVSWWREPHARLVRRRVDPS